ncbi:MAG: HAMP domain-containing sensor histidine kinase [Patescibacteria group bacterium]
MNPLLCPDSVPSFLGFFDFSIAPHLLFYTYIPAILISIFLGFFVYHKENGSLSSKLLFAISAFFTLWVLDIFILWISAYNDAVMLGWQITPILEVPIFIFSLYFAYVITDKDRSDIKPQLKCFFILIMGVVFYFLPTLSNIVSYNISVCEGLPGKMWDMMYVGEIIIIMWILGLCIARHRTAQNNILLKKQIIFIGIGLISFLTLFVGSNLVGQITGIQEISFIGSLGMVVFLALLVYLIVRYKTFNIKLIGANVLVLTLWIATASLFAIDEISTIRAVVAGTLILITIFGYILINSVRREVSQRKKIENLAGELAMSNEGQKNLIHIMNHQIKGFLGVAKNIFAELLTGDYGVMPEPSKPLLTHGLEEMGSGVDYVQGILRGASAQSGVLPYSMKPVDLMPLVSDLIKERKEVAEKKELSFESNITPGDYNIVGDGVQIKEAFKNLITNAIKYNSPKGNVKVAFEKEYGKIIFSVKDTGIGIAEEDKAKLFTAGGVGKNSIKHNTDAAGYGLSFVKGVAEAHKGRVGYKSNSPEKGTTFFIELPVK